MAAPENKYQKLARKHFLDADSPLIANTYEFEGPVMYDTRAINIFHTSGVQLKEYMFDFFIGNQDFVNSVLEEGERRKTKLTQEILAAESKPDLNLDDVEKLYNSHFDFEAMIMDKLVSVSRFQESLEKIVDSEQEAAQYRNFLFQPANGRTFFEESAIMRLQAYGHQEGDERFEKFDLNWYCRRVMTKYRLYDVLEHFSSDFLQSLVEEIRTTAVANRVHDADEAYQTIIGIRLDQATRRKSAEESFNKVRILDVEKGDGSLAPFLDFLSESIVHNEEMRLYRSRTFYMFSQVAIAADYKPMAFYMDCNARRKARIKEEFSDE